MLRPDDLRRLSPDERAELLRELIRLADDDPLAAPRLRLRRRFGLAILTATCVWLVPWTVVLGFTLPEHYTAGQWRVAWIGFDIGLTLALAATAFAAWRRLQVIVLGQIVCGTLLVCDAWFDTMLSWGSDEFPVSVATALLGELPLAGLLFYAARHVVLTTVHSMWIREGRDEPEPRLRDLRIFTVEHRKHLRARRSENEGEKEHG